jgi:hypothetical protein
MVDFSNWQNLEFVMYNIGFMVGGIGICIYLLWFIEFRLDRFMERNIDPLIAAYNKRVKAADERRAARKEKKKQGKLIKQISDNKIERHWKKVKESKEDLDFLD